MRAYSVPTASFFAPYLQGFGPEFAASRLQMERLIDRFQLQGKRVLSIGPGVGSEEYWFSAYGNCALTFVDIDEHGSIEPLLQGLPRSAQDSASHERLTYLIGDAAELPAITEGFDLVYISSFTPEEFRRFEIQQRTLGSGLRRVWHRLRLAEDWPRDAGPLSDWMLQLIDGCLAPGGVFCLQEYYAPINRLWNGHLICQIQAQLAGIGVQLLEHYHLVQRPWYGLSLACREDLAAAQDRLRAAAACPPLVAISARLAPRARIARSFSLLEESTPDLRRLRRGFLWALPRRVGQLAVAMLEQLGRRLLPRRPNPESA